MKTQNPKNSSIQDVKDFSEKNQAVLAETRRAAEEIEDDNKRIQSELDKEISDITDKADTAFVNLIASIDLE